MAKHTLKKPGRVSSEPPREDYPCHWTITHLDENGEIKKHVQIFKGPWHVHEWIDNYHPEWRKRSSVELPEPRFHKNEESDWPEHARTGGWKFDEEIAKVNRKYPIQADSKTIEDALNEVKKDLKLK